MPFNNFPYTNLNDLNLDFVLGKIKQIMIALENAGTPADYKIFSNYETMAEATMTPGQYCVTLGYYDPGDGGAAIYRYENGNFNLLECHNIRQTGAMGDGQRDDTFSIQEAINKSTGLVEIPDGTFIISDSITIPEDRALELRFLSGSCVKATQAVPMFIVTALTANVHSRVNKITGSGVIDMASVATCAIKTTDSSIYLEVSGINIENCTKTGIEMGGSGQNSQSAMLHNIQIRGITGTAAGSVGVRLLAKDCYIESVNIVRCETGIKAEQNSGGHMINNVHIWNDVDIDSAQFENTCGLYLEGANILLNNVYLDNCKTGIYTTFKMTIDGLFYYLPYTPSTAKTVHIISMADLNKAIVNRMFVDKKDNVTTVICYVRGRAATSLFGSNKRFLCEHVITSVDGFNPVDEAFNIGENKFTGQLHALIQGTPISIPQILLGYLSDTTGEGDLVFNMGQSYTYDLHFKTTRATNMSAPIATLISGAGTSGATKIVIGQRTTVNGLSVYPVYMTRTTNYSQYLGIEYKPIGESNFYLNAHVNAADCAFTGTINALHAINI